MIEEMREKDKLILPYLIDASMHNIPCIQLHENSPRLSFIDPDDNLQTLTVNIDMIPALLKTSNKIDLKNCRIC